MGDMRHNPVRDVAFHLVNYYHWKDTLPRSVSDDGDRSLRSLRTAAVYLHGLQLHIRAIVQLSMISLHCSSNSAGQVCDEALETIPRFVSFLFRCVERYAVALSFVDGYDIFATALIFIHFGLLKSNVTGRRLSLDDMKVVITCMDLLQGVSNRFEAMQGLRGVMWAFMAAREETLSIAEGGGRTGQSGTVSTGAESLREACKKAMVPRDLAVFMQDALHYQE
jgi:hypothetical protein